ncbi:class I SAM-dependent methyltransferase [Campylobacter fetus]|uniref:Class I SAM-dependent methyltransferase n=3 Tax=Campylobacter fetus TaxID=196 RepID=A0A5L4KDC6_CAMFE|nr:MULTISPECIES: class I SAM-dependent methyltransferase [Campylobacter]OCS25284.1 methyltransferase [Campylobacter fetus subsp. venerealis cfvB10]OCS29465.1 methyltransferase [Campylobacter fetus subsp. venerealis LMG 6570 = CCUG 33900]ABK82862.1 conserved hypothetical protein [Campylobacter fetus subsp. fetus 82-40]AIR79489.1 SAM-dependent methyltransferase [Campylobacter fetus subsp. fetus 04/554]AIR81349.1 SAM-dependent methyltransferase [Campylobacter fetus subsp. venerealis 97/608]
MQKDLIEQNWDYTKHAEFYSYRPNYAKQAIDILAFYACRNGGGYGNMSVADIGAGSGNLSLMLDEIGLKVTAVEPNDAMRSIGEQRLPNVTWVRANGTDTTLMEDKFDWVTFGSSFNVMDRNIALKEAHRILKKDGVMSAMWNHRDLNDPIQKIAQDIIKSFIKDYSGGVRREDQRPILEAHSKLFKDIFYIEQDFYFHQSIENYILAWKSVKNSFWDLETKEGSELFERICSKLRSELPKEFDIRYTTRAWSVTKVR